MNLREYFEEAYLLNPYEVKHEEMASPIPLKTIPPRPTAIHSFKSEDSDYFVPNEIYVIFGENSHPQFHIGAHPELKVLNHGNNKFSVYYNRQPYKIHRLIEVDLFESESIEDILDEPVKTEEISLINLSGYRDVTANTLTLYAGSNLKRVIKGAKQPKMASESNESWGSW